MTKYSKFAAAVAGLAATFAEVLADGSISAAEWGVLGTAVATAVAVFAVPNKA